MAYIKIFSNDKKRQIGEMRLINGRNVIFNMHGKEVGYCTVTDEGEQFYDMGGHFAETVENILEEHNKNGEAS